MQHNTTPANSLKILQVCHKMPYPVKDGGSYSLFYTAKGLIWHHAEVRVLAVNTPKDRIDINCIPADFLRQTRLEYTTIDTRMNYFKSLSCLFSGGSYFVQRFFSKDFDEHLKKILQKEEFGIVQIEHIYMFLYIDTIIKYSKAKVVFRPQNVEHQIWKDYVQRGANPFMRLIMGTAIKRLMRFEITMAGRADGIMAISPADAEFFVTYAGGRPVCCIPAGFDLSRTGGSQDINTHNDVPVFYHLGSMDWLPNRQGLKWFVRKVMPRVIKHFQDFQLRLAGKKIPPWFYKRANKNLAIDGEVEDSVFYQEDKSVLVVPLLCGSGVRIKIIEAMALGKVVISTRTGAEGIPYTEGKNILIADTHEEFAAQISRCIQSNELCSTLGRNAQKLAMTHFDMYTNAERMMAFYQEIIGH